MMRGLGQSRGPGDDDEDPMLKGRGTIANTIAQVPAPPLRKFPSGVHTPSVCLSGPRFLTGSIEAVHAR